MLNDPVSVGCEVSCCMLENMLDDSVGVGGGGSYCMPENNALKGTEAARGGRGGSGLFSIAIRESRFGAASSCTICGDDLELGCVGVHCLKKIARMKLEI